MKAGSAWIAGLLARRRPRCAGPSGDQRAGCALQFGERSRGLLALGLQRVDAQIERRARGERRALLGPLVAERRGELRVEPFGIIASDMRRRAVEIVPRERARVRRRVSGARRKARAIGELRDRLGIEAALARQHAEQHGARRLRAHDPGGGGLAAQRVVDEPRDRGAIARAGEAMRQAPVLQRLRGRAAARLDVGENLDGGGKTRGGVMRSFRMILSENRDISGSCDAKQDAHREDDPHDQQDEARRPRRRLKRVRHVVRGGVDVGMHEAREHEDPRHHDEQSDRRACVIQREDHQHIEQQRNLELAVVAVARSAWRAPAMRAGRARCRASCVSPLLDRCAVRADAIQNSRRRSARPARRPAAEPSGSS